eukprot:4067601-Pleurochrysis_carterae.AAC.1
MAAAHPHSLYAATRAGTGPVNVTPTLAPPDNRLLPPPFSISNVSKPHFFFLPFPHPALPSTSPMGCGKDRKEWGCDCRKQEVCDCRKQ